MADLISLSVPWRVPSYDEFGSGYETCFGQQNNSKYGTSHRVKGAGINQGSQRTKGPLDESERGE